MEHNKGRNSGNLPHDDKKRREEGEVARRELDEIPAPGTDPLHEGP